MQAHHNLTPRDSDFDYDSVERERMLLLHRSVRQQTASLSATAAPESVAPVRPSSRFRRSPAEAEMLRIVDLPLSAEPLIGVTAFRVAYIHGRY